MRRTRSRFGELVGTYPGCQKFGGRSQKDRLYEDPIKNESATVDRHISAFLEEAGIQMDSYDEAWASLNAIADEMGIHQVALDHSIW